MITRLAIVLAIFLVLIWVLWTAYKEENFENRDTKARAIYDWFNNNSSHDYASYRTHTGGDSNIVEYEDVRKLFADKNLTLASVRATI